MAKKKATDTMEMAEKLPLPTSPSDPAGAPPAEQNGQQTSTAPRSDAQPAAEPQNGERKPVKVLTYQVNHDSYVQASIWDRKVRRRDGTEYLTYEVTVRKRWREGEAGDWKSGAAFAASELYAVVYALEAAGAVILELRSAEVPF